MNDQYQDAIFGVAARNLFLVAGRYGFSIECASEYGPLNLRRGAWSWTYYFNGGNFPTASDLENLRNIVQEWGPKLDAAEAEGKSIRAALASESVQEQA